MSKIFWRELHNEKTQEFAEFKAEIRHLSVRFGKRPRDSFELNGTSSSGTYCEDYEASHKRALEVMAEYHKKGLTETDASQSFRCFVKGDTTWTIYIKQDVIVEDDRQQQYFPSREAALHYYYQQIVQHQEQGFKEVEPRDTAYSKAIPPEYAAPLPKVKAKPAAKSKAKTKTAPVVEEPAIVTEVTNRIDLAPLDWYRAHWRKLPPLPKPEPPPFDREAALEKLRGIQFSSQYYSGYQLTYPDGPVSREEALFWVEASLRQREHANPHGLARALAKLPLVAIAPQDLSERAKGSWLAQQMLVWMFSPEEFIAFAHLEGGRTGLGMEFFERVVPYLEVAERERLAGIAGPLAKDALWHAGSTRHLVPEIIAVAAALGASEAVEAMIKSGNYNHYYVSPLLYGLASAAQFEAAYDALEDKKGYWHSDPRKARAWLAHTEMRRLDELRDGILNLDKDGSNRFAEVLALVKSPLAAPHMLALRTQGKAVQVATQWLDQQVGNAVTGLMEVACGQGNLATAALDYLKQKARAGYQDLVQQAAAKCEAKGIERVRAAIAACKPTGPALDEKTSPKWLNEAIATASALKPIKGASDIDAAALPPLSIAEGTLSPAHVETVLLALQHSELGSPQSIISHLRQHADPTSRGDFAWSLFDAWLMHDAPAKQKWAMKALGHLGTDETALRLAGLVRKWPGESQHQRAVLGLDCLRAIGTTGALMQLSGIAQKVKFKALQNKAGEYVEAIAKDQGLSRAELEDRVIPDCGLDDRGQRTFDFGPRQFTFALGSDLKPMVRDAAKKLLSDLPKPNSKDEADKAKLAQQEWKLLKTQIKEVAKLQAVRLEQAMVLRRRWPISDFQELLVRQPLMIHLVRTLLWAGYDDRGQRQLLFRVTDEQDLADAGDNRAALDGVANVGIVHPLELESSEAAKWGEIFADYELVPPFAQLGRPTYAPNDNERGGVQLTRFIDLTFPAPTLVGTLERFGWLRGPGLDNGSFFEHFKQFPTTTAVVGYEPGPSMQYLAESDDQNITACCFKPAGFKPRGYDKPGDELPLAEVDPIVLSEVILDLTQLAAKAK